MSIVVFQTDVSSSVALPSNTALSHSFDSYKSPVALLHDNTTTEYPYKFGVEYKKMIANSSATLMTLNGVKPEDFVKLSEEYPREYRFQFITAVFYAPAYRVVMYNPLALHSALLSFDLWMESIFRYTLKENYGLRVINEPFKYIPKQSTIDASIRAYGHTLAIFIGIAVGIVSASYISFYVEVEHI